MKKLFLICLIACGSINMKAQTCTPVSGLVAGANSTNTEIDAGWIPTSYGYNEFFVNGVQYKDPSSNQMAWVTSVNMMYLRGTYVGGQSYQIEVRTHAYNQPNYCDACDVCSSFFTVIFPAIVPPPVVVSQVNSGKKNPKH